MSIRGNLASLACGVMSGTIDQILIDKTLLETATHYKRQENNLHVRRDAEYHYEYNLSRGHSSKSGIESIGLEPVVSGDLELVRGGLPMNVDLCTLESDPAVLVPRLGTDLAHAPFELRPRHFFQSKV
jgi:hypothetical protein